MRVRPTVRSGPTCRQARHSGNRQNRGSPATEHATPSNGVVGNPLVRALADIYHDHGLQEQAYEEQRFHEQESDEIPRIICSEALV